MSTSTVHHIVTTPDGAPIKGVVVQAVLVTAVNGTYPGLTGNTSITQLVTTTTAADGSWSLALTPNSEVIVPTGTYYVVYEGGYPSTIVVPAGGGPYDLESILVGSPPAPATQYVVSPATVAVKLAGTAVGSRPAINFVSGTNVTVAAADNPGSSRVDVTINATGGGGGAVTSVNGLTGAVVLGAPDVGADVAGAGYYPISAMGFCAIAAAPETFTGDSSLSTGDFFVPRMWVPGGQPIARAAVHIHTAGTFASDGLFNGAVVFDDAGNQLGISADTPTLWAAAGWRNVALTATIAPQAAGRFVRVGFMCRGWTGTHLWFSSPFADVLNGGITTTHRRNIVQTGTTAVPASINPATFGTASSFVPPFALGPV